MKLIKLVTLLPLLIMLFSLNINALASGEFDINSPEVKEIASQFSMQGHENHDLATCSTKLMYYEDIAELLNEGMSEQEILDYYYSMYGEQGLRAPKMEGFSLTAWLTPFLILGVAGFTLFVGLNNLVRKQRKHLLNKDDEEVDVEKEIINSVIDEERKKYF